jgi:RNA polymerase sigma-70 factor (ECF subfamily)
MSMTSHAPFAVVAGAASVSNSDATEARGRTSIEAVIYSQLPWIRRRLRLLFPRHLDLDEIEQQVLLSVVRGLPSYRGEGSLRAWVDSITLRIGMKHARHVRARESREQVLVECLCAADDHLPSEQYFMRRELKALLSALSLPQQRAMVLRHVMGLKVSEVAEYQGVPTETARSRLREGMKLLRRRARIRESALP